ncbi:GAF domain-containing protein [Saccharothrix tamanrassetensis]|uniref:GAF domain-containing protein n=1 Tax=Saccharothrix tamanrassetensis TaxID=1051531 RepID=A0A841CMU0_9PSEU|nr:GAF and ANTAR domain-containing protein [Saccharothrix tamanrassetensis]MBB5958619.1 GAF domain-containing protein [Saccharothrix tamanrassetensis]
MPGVHDQIASELSELTASLVGQHDADSVLRLVTAACTKLLGASATGVMMVDPRGGISVVSASDERARFVELLQSQIDQGPCVDCIRGDVDVGCPDLAAELDRWPSFGQAAFDTGFRAIHAVTLRLDGRPVGGLNLLYTRTAHWETWQERLGRVLGDLAVLGLSQERDPSRMHRLAERTLTALNDRVLLAHATGLVAGVLDTDTGQARSLISDYAARRHDPLRDVARAIVDGGVDPAALRPTPDSR